MHSLRCQLLFPVQNTRFNKIVLNDVPSSLSSILKTPQDDGKVRCVKKHWNTEHKKYWKPRRKTTAKKNPNTKNPTRKSNSKTQLEILTRKPTRKSSTETNYAVLVLHF